MKIYIFIINNNIYNKYINYEYIKFALENYKLAIFITLVVQALISFSRKL